MRDCVGGILTLHLCDGVCSHHQDILYCMVQLLQWSLVHTTTFALSKCLRETRYIQVHMRDCVGGTLTLHLRDGACRRPLDSAMLLLINCELFISPDCRAWNGGNKGTYIVYTHRAVVCMYVHLYMHLYPG